MSPSSELEIRAVIRRHGRQTWPYTDGCGLTRRAIRQQCQCDEILPIRHTGLCPLAPSSQERYNVGHKQTCLALQNKSIHDNSESCHTFGKAFRAAWCNVWYKCSTATGYPSVPRFSSLLAALNMSSIPAMRRHKPMPRTKQEHTTTVEVIALPLELGLLG